MGTNYYLVKEKQEPCKTCMRPYEVERIHIGKSSGGWCFLLHVQNPNDEESIPKSLKDWDALFQSKEWNIENEYGNKLSRQDMLDEITIRSSGKIRTGEPPSGYRSWDLFYKSNCAEIGPNNLLRCIVLPEVNNCIGHGPGTWDLITGEFS